MKKSELEKLYRRVAKEIGFKEDPTQKGWMPKLGPNDYKCKIIHGFTKSGSVTLFAGPKDFIDPDFLLLDGSYKVAQSKAPKPHILLPCILEIKTEEDCCWFTKERVDGTRLLRDFPFFDGLEKFNIANLYWNTVDVFSRIEQAESKANFEDFFRDRLKKWVELGKSCKSKASKQKLETLRTVADDFFRYVFYETDLGEIADLEMGLFFKNFGNTDIVVQGDNFYLPSSEIVPLPQFYGAAYFVWNMLMYVHDSEKEGVVEDIQEWRGAFYGTCPKELRNQFFIGFNLLLFERVMGALLVDIPLRRSPFDAKGGEGRARAKRAEKIFVEVLKYLLNKIPTLVENEPFKENFAALAKIYK